ncbi:hypothetical protein BGZ80_009119 [Entomortierella chlamydospora]|uniref:Calpain catalytic domain-containing protein n=1 Tax=Entomortierella chlamydospora TaxID=101097 RepID=A0A9P6MY09_9FUNG|nr:hypothetical protein BGZ79_009324 [Entomortierella chlamydospora]KAG0016576.1 hypothetical protein BGZ80_009119 [Entomortierella chlamydospora]
MVSKTKKRVSPAAKIAKANKLKEELLRPSVPLVATAAMKAARKACAAKVDAIIAECHENNTKFRDLKFDLLDDFSNCLYSSAVGMHEFERIDGSKRVGDLFRNTVFFEDGATPQDIKQGNVGDCWFMAALAVVSNIPGLLEQLCVKWDEEVGVYGFIFFKDGDWVSTVVDDQLFYTIDPYSFKNKLFFSSCSSERETWLPLMEKAYAKIHGDYQSISGGYTAEGIEDLTGGVSSMIYISDILSKDRFWETEMKNVNQSVLLGCWITHVDGGVMEKNGIQMGHAYSVLKVAEFEGERLVQVRNPWGDVEWNGDWSDDSDRWTPEAKAQLQHKQCDDGVFWMSYRDFLRTFTMIDRCKTFDSSWSVVSNWIPYNVVPRSSGKFEFHTRKGGDTVIVLTQPDTRYFGALVPEYDYQLSFHVYDIDKKLIKRSRRTGVLSNRSVSCEVNLNAGTTYTIIPYISRTANDIRGALKGIEGDFKGNAVLPSQGDENIKVDNEPTKISPEEFMFKQRKVENIRAVSIARLKGQILLGVDDDDHLEQEALKEKSWEITIGLRIYSHDHKATLDGIPGEHPVKTGVSPESEPDTPEAVTATLADKKSDKDGKDNKDGKDGKDDKDDKNDKDEKKIKEKIVSDDHREE